MKNLVVLLIVLGVAGYFFYTMKNSAAEEGSVASVRDRIIEVKGQSLLLVMVFNSQCYYCKQKFPDIVKVISKYPNLDILGVSADSNRRNLDAFINQYNLDFEIIHLDPNKNERLIPALNEAGFGISEKTIYFPLLTVIDKDGTVKSRSNEPVAMELAIKWAMEGR